MSIERVATETRAQGLLAYLCCKTGATSEMGSYEVLTLGTKVSASFAIRGKKPAVLLIHIPKEYKFNIGLGLVAEKKRGSWRMHIASVATPVQDRKGKTIWSEWFKQQQA